jgi:hypothetical protein
MKSISYALSLLLLIGLSVFSSCKDDTTEETEEQRVTRQLTSGIFTVTEVSLAPDTEYNFEGPATINFSDNNTFVIEGAESLPNPGSTADTALPEAGTWSFTDTQNHNQLRLSSSGSSVDITIISLDDTELVFEYLGAEPKPEDEVRVKVRASRN